MAIKYFSWNFYICWKIEYSLVNIELDPEQIATKGFIAFLSSTMHIKQHTKSLPKLKNHKGSNYDAEEMIVHAKM